MIQIRWNKITKACNRTWNFALAKCFYLRCKHNYNSKSNQTECISKDKWYSRHIVLHILISILEFIILIRNLTITKTCSCHYFTPFTTRHKLSFLCHKIRVNATHWNYYLLHLCPILKYDWWYQSFMRQLNYWIFWFQSSSWH